jgi:hypothetical protein
VSLVLITNIDTNLVRTAILKHVVNGTAWGPQAHHLMSPLYHGSPTTIVTLPIIGQPATTTKSSHTIEEQPCRPALPDATIPEIFLLLNVPVCGSVFDANPVRTTLHECVVARTARVTDLLCPDAAAPELLIIDLVCEREVPDSYRATMRTISRRPRRHHRRGAAPPSC